MMKKNSDILWNVIKYVVLTLIVVSTVTIFFEALYTEYHALGFTSEKVNSYRGYKVAFGGEDHKASLFAIAAYFLPLFSGIILLAFWKKYPKLIFFLTAILLYLSLVLKLLMPYYAPIPLALGLYTIYGTALIVDVVIIGFNSLLAFGAAVFTR
ncbi:MAG: hypothetical protein M0R05_03890 [Bacilli bacterium]|nr:hypothetical protein [Bacilli bacterium]MDD4077052.1 hypothetical protein [Bacilli bacterium]